MPGHFADAMIVVGMRRGLLSMVFIVAGCGSPPPVDTPTKLLGTWQGDLSRLEQLRVVADTRGDERARALARAKDQLSGLRIVFTADEATMTTTAKTLSVPYQVRGWQGPMVELQTLQDGRVVATSLRVDDDQLTWFDREGEIEFVLRRVSD